MIPESHRDLLTGRACGVITTLMPDGQPRSSLVWVDYDGECACLNTTRERRKGRDLERDARASLLVVDPNDTTRFLLVHGRVELVEEGRANSSTGSRAATRATRASTATSSPRSRRRVRHGSCAGSIRTTSRSTRSTVEGRNGARAHQHNGARNRNSSSSGSAMFMTALTSMFMRTAERDRRERFIASVLGANSLALVRATLSDC